MDKEDTQTYAAITSFAADRGKRPLPVAFIFLTGAVILFGFVIACIAERGAMPLSPGWQTTPFNDSYVVSQVDGAAANAGMMINDRLLAVNNDNTAGWFGPLIPLSRIMPGERYVVSVSRNRRLIDLHLAMGSPPAEPWHEWFTDLFVAILLYAVGAWVGTQKWHDFTARLAAATFILSSLAMLQKSLSVAYPGWNSATATAAVILSNFWRPWNLPVAYHFLSRFPQATEERAWQRSTRWFLYLAAGLSWFAFNTLMLAQMLKLPAIAFLSHLAQLRGDHQPGRLIISGLEAFAAFVMCLTIVRNYRMLPDQASRRKIRWASVGFGLALILFCVLALARLEFFWSGQQALNSWYDPLESAAVIIIGIAPLTLGYAVAKHRVLGIRVVVRQGLQYLLAKKMLQLLVLLPIILIAIQIAINPNIPLTRLLMNGSWKFNLMVMLTGLMSLRFRREMQLWLDRKFFRTAYQQEQVLAELVEHIKGAESEQELYLILAREIELAFPMDGFHILMRNQQSSGLVIVYSRYTDRAAKFRDYINQDWNSVSSASVRTLFHFDDQSKSGIARYPQYQEHLLVPVNDKAIGSKGVLLLGPKRSDEPYTTKDRELLKTIASQIGIMCEMLHLKRIVRDEGKVKAEVLGHLARQRFELLMECPDCGLCFTSNESECSRDGARLSLTLPVEKTIDGKYRLERRIGQGGMGVVYHATDLRLDRAVAIKILVGALFGSNSAIARFEREARAAALLDHRNIISIHDFGEISAGGAYIVMEFVRGLSWREFFRTHNTLQPLVVADFMSQLCSAVEAAHQKGIVHRDLKPENFVIEQSAADRHRQDTDAHYRVVVLDFGLAQVRSELTDAGKDLTVAGAVFGTWDYMSPEQRLGLQVDRRTDIYSLAVICAETISGVRPPSMGSSANWLRSGIRGVTQEPRLLLSALEKALSENAADRHSSVSEFEVELLDAFNQTVFKQGPRLQGLAATQQSTVTHLPTRFRQ